MPRHRTYVGGTSREEIYYLRRRRRHADLAVVDDRGIPPMIDEARMRPYDDLDNRPGGAFWHEERSNSVWEYVGPVESQSALDVQVVGPNHVVLWEDIGVEADESEQMLWGAKDPSGTAGDGDLYVKVDADGRGIEIWEFQP